jgi:mono/diheme cytochrome c family protein
LEFGIFLFNDCHLSKKYVKLGKPKTLPMKKILKVVLYLVATLVVVIAGVLTYVKTALPDVGDPEDLKIEYTQERVERGKYLANSVTGCVDCHSLRDWNKLGGPRVEGTMGKGGELFGREFGFPGNFYSRNITPHGVGGWTDGELFRAITSGVSKDGRALFPVMPYQSFGKMDREDIYSIIAYVRSLESIASENQPSEADFPMNFIMNTIPAQPQFTTIPPSTDTLAYGKYMLNAAVCNHCHTPKEQGKEIEGKHLAGGFEFQLPQGIARSANITPDMETGIGLWTEDVFVGRFKAYADSAFTPPLSKAGDFQTVMPWLFYCNMKEDDLRAMYKYLRTVPAIKNKVVKFESKGATP